MGFQRKDTKSRKDAKFLIYDSKILEDYRKSILSSFALRCQDVISINQDADWSTVVARRNSRDSTEDLIPEKPNRTAIDVLNQPSDFIASITSLL
jgi:hypothetical protein